MIRSNKPLSIRLPIRVVHRGLETQQSSATGAIFGDDSYRNPRCYVRFVCGRRRLAGGRLP